MENGRFGTVYGPKRAIKTGLLFCGLIAFAFFFLWKLSPTANPANGVPKKDQFSQLPVSSSIGVFYRAPLNHPKENGPFRASIAEFEYEEDTEAQDVGFCFSAADFMAVPYHALFEKTLSALPPAFVQNRPTVPLFVLHHAWKNFL